MHYDVIIIGGSYAGLSAALPLARARRKVLLIDAGERRNRYAAKSYGFLTQDGVPPARIAAEGKAQLLAYGTVDWRDAVVEEAGQGDGAFFARTAQGQTYTAERLILATGVRDTLPDVPGLAARWGKSVFHCPYCHGYELQQGRIGVLAVSPLSLHQGLMLPDWGATTLFLNDRFAPDAQQQAQLQARGTTIESGLVARVQGDDAAPGLELVLADGRVFALDGLFVASQTRPGPLAAQLGCLLEDGPMGPFIQTDATKATTVPGVFACGDAARAAGSVTLAVGDGAMAGLAAHRSLMFGLDGPR